MKTFFYINFYFFVPGARSWFVLCSFRGGEGFRVPGVGVIFFGFCFVLGATKGKALTRDLYQRERETKKKNSRPGARAGAEGQQAKKTAKNRGRGRCWFWLG